VTKAHASLAKRYLKDTLARVCERRGYRLIPEWELGAVPLVDHLRRVLTAYDVDCVIDVGANLGQYRDLLRERVGYPGPIISFEPVRSFFQVIARAAERDPAWRVVPFGLGERDQTLPLTVFSSPGLSSVLPADVEAMGHLLPGGAPEVVGTEDVAIRRLDEVYFEVAPEPPPARILLKVDTQGYDTQVIAGAIGLIERVCALQTEVAVQRLYRGAPDMPTSLAVVEALGFQLSGLFPVTLDRSLCVIEFDAVLVRPSAWRGHP
jgi:FkbM family methyltransferase